MEKFLLYIGWDKKIARQLEDSEANLADLEVVEFDTPAERQAYIDGASAANGWDSPYWICGEDCMVENDIVTINITPAQQPNVTADLTKIVIETKVVVSGVVLGLMWNGEEGTIPFAGIEAPTAEEAQAIAAERLSNGTLQPHGDFSRLLGARIDVLTIKTIRYGNEIFTNKQTEVLTIGENLTEEQEELLLNSY